MAEGRRAILPLGGSAVEQGWGGGTMSMGEDQWGNGLEKVSGGVGVKTRGRTVRVKGVVGGWGNGWRINKSGRKGFETTGRRREERRVEGRGAGNGASGLWGGAGRGVRGRGGAGHEE
ncbi:hypothetical protein Tco_0698742 [Tanacetum coccineum]